MSEANRFNAEGSIQRIIQHIDKTMHEELRRMHPEYAAPEHADSIYERVHSMLAMFERPEEHVADLVDIAVIQYKNDLTGVGRPSYTALTPRDR